ncbi:MAG: MiaB/RimO family radical SAM methylthiotransferase [Elusimicrobia bacterium]|nr:MiaB/RimO family radical SAM methylthiotransferase [Candidatus Liberimonas magnetica]
MKKFFMLTNNCLSSNLVTKKVELFFKVNGWSPSKKAEKADIILFNTCAFIKENEDKCFDIIAQFQKVKKKDAIFVVFGCLLKINRTRLIDNFDGIIIDSDSLILLDKLIDADKSIASVTSRQLTTDYAGRKTYNINAASGCLSSCSYCGIKKVFPKLKSLPKNEIVKEFAYALEQGHKKLGLTGGDLWAYGKDLETNLVDLLNEIIKLKGEYKIALWRLNPKWIKEMGSGLMKILESGRIDYISLPVQSGSDRILKAMNRQYKIDGYKDFVKTIRKKCPNILISTDFIVGFPGETNKDFKESLKLVFEMGFDAISVCEFGKIKNTPAWCLKDDVPKHIKRKRNIQLLWAAKTGNRNVKQYSEKQNHSY